MTAEEEIKMLRAENEMYKRELAAHGIKVRQVEIKEDTLIKLFGVKELGGLVIESRDRKQMRTNYNTFVSNLIRVILPYPRGNKHGWIGHKPFKEMTDLEFDECKKLISNVIKLCLESKNNIERKRIPNE